MSPQESPAWMVAVLAALFSFISPCVLPLIPGYLSMISGLSTDQLQQRSGRHLWRVFFSCLLFALGFGSVFILLGASAGVVGNWLGPRMRIFNVILGLLVIVFGLFVLNLIKLPFLYQDRRFRVGRTSLGLGGAFLLGLAFGFGWTPCVGPWLGTLYVIAANRTTAQAAALFAVYSAVLGLCFIAAGMLFAYALNTFRFLQRHYRIIESVSGGLLILIGVLLVTQQWDRATAAFMRLLQ
jgi:cytochrome c-type biogenesis protein